MTTRSKTKALQYSHFQQVQYVHIGDYFYDPYSYQHDYCMNRIYQGTNKHSNQRVLIKAISIKNRYSDISNNYIDSLDEAQIINMMNGHQNIISLIDTKQTEEQLFLIWEQPVRTLQYILSRQKLQQHHILCLFVDIVYALQTIHQKGFLHRCLTTKNIILDHQKMWKINGFQYAIQIGHYTKKNKQQNNMDRYLYLAPQTLSQGQWTQKSDIWAVGIILYFMLHQKHPFISNKSHKMQQKYLLQIIKQKNINSNGNYQNPILPRILNMCLKTNPKMRGSLQNIIHLLNNDLLLPHEVSQLIQHKKLRIKQQKQRFQKLNSFSNKLQQSQKEAYYILFINRLFKLLQKVEKTENTQLLFAVTQLFLRKQIKKLAQSSLQYRRNMSNLPELKPQWSQFYQIVKQLQKMYKNYFKPQLSEKLAEYQQFAQENQKNLLIRFQALLRKSIHYFSGRIKNLHDHQIQKYEYEIYTEDFLTSCYYLNSKIIKDEMKEEQVWNFIELQDLKNIAQKPLKQGVNKIKYQVLEKIFINKI